MDILLIMSNRVATQVAHRRQATSHRGRPIQLTNHPHNRVNSHTPSNLLTVHLQLLNNRHMEESSINLLMEQDTNSRHISSTLQVQTSSLLMAHPQTLLPKDNNPMEVNIKDTLHHHLLSHMVPHRLLITEDLLHMAPLPLATCLSHNIPTSKACTMLSILVVCTATVVQLLVGLLCHRGLIHILARMGHHPNTEHRLKTNMVASRDGNAN